MDSSILRSCRHSNWRTDSPNFDVQEKYSILRRNPLQNLNEKIFYM